MTLLLFLLLIPDTTKPVFNPKNVVHGTRIDSVRTDRSCGTFVTTGNKRKNKRRNKREWGW